MDVALLELSNSQGVSFSIPLAFAGKESCVGDKVVSYQLLKLKHSGSFSTEELYRVAATLQEVAPGSKVDWVATFLLLDKKGARYVRKKLRTAA